MSAVLKLSKEYLMLIRRFPLRPIRTLAMLDEASQLLSELTLKARKRTQDETDYLSVLKKLVADYESTHLKDLNTAIDPQESLVFLMNENSLSQSQLARELGCTQSNISDFLAKRRSLSKALIRKLSDRFKVSPELFLP